jgi:mRNA-degrading endonuclease YafQ of YafQ-DinJ toxin-antitoxin module
MRCKIDDVLQAMHEEVFRPALGTHKLSGKLVGLWACSCGYDCRIIFTIQTAEEGDAESILPLDIGTHYEVY